ncbi:nuclear transport factor 2 family protein [Aurantimonas sp. NFXS3]
MHRAAEALIAACNAFDVDAAVALFRPEAVIDDPSTGQRFDGHPGIRDYVTQFFVGYHSVTRLLSIEAVATDRTRVRADFTGDFGHEVGLLDVSVDQDGFIVRIDADLE